MIAIGIDNGIKGCATAVEDCRMIDVARFKAAEPTRVFNMMCGTPLKDLLARLQTDPRTILILLEDPAINQGRGTTAHSIASTAASFGRVLLILEAAGIPTENIHTCAAVSWQKLWWKTNLIKKDYKPSIGIAQNLFGETFIPKGCKKPDDGWTDAALMAYTLSNPELREKFLKDETERGISKVKAKAKKKAQKIISDGELRKLLGGYN